MICCTRYGNVMCSRGSVIPLFIEQIKNGTPITITNPDMTRFLMNLDEAVELVMFAFQHANLGISLFKKRMLLLLEILPRQYNISLEIPELESLVPVMGKNCMKP